MSATRTRSGRRPDLGGRESSSWWPRRAHRSAGRRKFLLLYWDSMRAFLSGGIPRRALHACAPRARSCAPSPVERSGSWPWTSALRSRADVILPKAQRSAPAGVIGWIRAGTALGTGRAKALRWSRGMRHVPRAHATRIYRGLRVKGVARNFSTPRGCGQAVAATAVRPVLSGSRAG